MKKVKAKEVFNSTKNTLFMYLTQLKIFLNTALLVVQGLYIAVITFREMIKTNSFDI